jgi:predicted HAD superfamily Cof-like phosphohydrolase
MAKGNTTTLNLVREFHRAFRIPVRCKPRLDPTCVTNRIRAMREELKEVADAANQALAVRAEPVERDIAMAHLIHELCDLQYVLDGAFLEFGLTAYRAAAFAEVHRANMSKLWPDGEPRHRADGKVLKGPNFKPADVLAIYRSTVL